MGDIWNYYCEKNNVPVAEGWLNDVKEYEKVELSKRKQCNTKFLITTRHRSNNI